MVRHISCCIALICLFSLIWINNAEEVPKYCYPSEWACRHASPFSCNQSGAGKYCPCQWAGAAHTSLNVVYHYAFIGIRCKILEYPEGHCEQITKHCYHMHWACFCRGTHKNRKPLLWPMDHMH